MEIYNLLAEYGDAFIIKTVAGRNPFTIVVDGGPVHTDSQIASYLRRMGHIDLMILTHYDEDHIGGLLEYMRKYRGEKLPVDHVWCNCAQEIYLKETEISDAGYRNAGTLAAYFCESVKHNPKLVWREDIKAYLVYTNNDLSIKVLSPTEDILSQLKSDYEEYLKGHPINIDDESNTNVLIASQRVLNDQKKSIDDLTQSDLPRSINLMNRSSIAFLLEAEGKRVLMLGDSDPQVVADAIEALGEPLPLKIDAVKVSHHGSLNNINKHLLSLIDCNRFMFSTNGGTLKSYHPDRKTLALILRKEHRTDAPIEFLFNYSLEAIQKRTGWLLSDEEREQENCKIIANTIKINL